MAGISRYSRFKPLRDERDGIFGIMKKRRRTRKAAVSTSLLQQAIRDSKLSQSEIARRANIDVGMVSRFLHGSRGITLATAERLADSLGLELIVRPKRIRKGR